MTSFEKVLLIDAGNTCIKTGYIHNGIWKSIKRFSLNDNQLDQYVATLGATPKVMSSVLAEKQTQHLKDRIQPSLIVNHQTALPITLAYKTPQTLGIDRICNACAMWNKTHTTVAVAIDVGTCIKFDVLIGNEYVGGSISPGINMRYHALNAFTGNLPLLQFSSKTPLIGESSEKSIHSGVINGISKEIEGFMIDYRLKFKEISFFITGGDACYFDFDKKNNIFAHENLTLEGLYSIFKFNAD
jgi:type III pantothenate kinase